MFREFWEKFFLRNQNKQQKFVFILALLTWVVYAVVSFLIIKSSVNDFYTEAAISYAKGLVDKPKIALTIIKKQIEKGYKYNKFDVDSLPLFPKTEAELKGIKISVLKKTIQTIPTEITNVKVNIYTNNNVISDKNEIQKFVLADKILKNTSNKGMIENSLEFDKLIKYYQYVECSDTSSKCFQQLKRFGLNNSTKLIVEVIFPHSKIAFLHYNKQINDIILRHFLLVFIGLFVITLFYIYSVKKKNAEDVLTERIKHEREKFKQLFSLAPFPILLCKIDGTIIEANESTVDLTEIDNDNLLKTTFITFFSTETLTKRPFDFERLKSERKIRTEYELISATGKKKHVIINAVYLYDDIFQVILVDVTEKQNLLDDLKAKNKIIEFADGHANIGSMEYNFSTKEIWISSGMLDLFGINKQTKITSPDYFLDFLAISDRERIKRNRYYLKNTDQMKFNITYKIKKMDGKEFWVEHLETIEKNSLGENMLITSIKDIDELTKMIESINETNNKFKRIFDFAQVALLIVDARFVYETLMNLAIEKKNIQLVIDSITDELLIQFLRFSKIKEINLYGSKLLKRKIEDVTLDQIVPKSEYKKIKKLYQYILEEKSNYVTSFDVNIDGEIKTGLLSITIPADFKILKTLIVSFSDLSEQIKTQKILHQTISVLTTYFDITPFLIISLNSKGEVDFINQLAIKTLGFTKEEILGKVWERDFVVSTIGRTIGENEDEENVTNKISTKNEEKIFQWTIKKVYDENNQLLLSLQVGRDISDEGRSNKEIAKSYKEIISLKHEIEKKNLQLIQAKQMLEEREKMLVKENSDKDRFFSIIAHDVRSPFTAILGMLQFLTENSADLTEEEKSEALSTVNRGVRNVYNLLDDLLEWSRLKMDKFPLEFREVNLYEVILNSILPFENSLEQKNISLIKEIPTEIFVFADERSLLTILRNLLSNAIKFSKTGGKITISVINKNGYAHISVIDTGVGIPIEAQNKLFKINEHHTTIGTNQEIGTGLGLILVQEFVEKNYGTIWFESEVGKGTKFTFTVPIVR